ncbi:MAG TPA: twin-arginine translocation signal domain-containing protein, partial [Bacillota bacterium]|nr:twin-arginine translocation signal domain-containing protein [Bacillota bacterium]
MNELTRRQFLHRTALASVAGGTLLAGFSGLSAPEGKKRKMTIDLVCGAIGVSANQREAIELAARHGFESVEAQGGYLASQSADQLAELKDFMKTKGIVFGASGLPVEFRQDDTRFAAGLKDLPRIAAGLQRAG